MDVHAPHQPIHGWKDFWIHLVTITIGLLIAVGIEGLVERYHEHALVKEARATMREEIAGNAETMKGATAKLAAERRTLDEDMKLLTRIAEHPEDKAAQDAHLSTEVNMVGLNDTAWRTAQATGALSYMPYAEAQEYASLYGMQASFVSQQDKILEDNARMMGVIAGDGSQSDATTPEQARLMLGQLGTWHAHLLWLEVAAGVSADEDAAFLKGEHGPHSASIHEGAPDR